jgi:hypothetical protein
LHFKVETAEDNVESKIPISYICMPRPVLSIGDLSVCAVQPQHIESIRQWRNAQMDILRQSAEITSDQQQAYYAKDIWPEMLSQQPKNILLIYLDQNIPIGYGGLVHVA